MKSSFQRQVRSWVVFGVSLSAIALEAPAAEKPVLESIQGAKTVSVIQGTQSRNAAAGAEIDFGERVNTDAKITVTLAYPDGSRVTIGPGSDYEIEPKLEDTQWNRLRSGLVRGIIEKPKDKKQEGNESPNRKPRFLIRSKTATMGVRGTDFVMEVDEATSIAKVRTLEGTVDVARNPAELMSGRTVPISEGQLVEATQSGLSQVQSFDRTEFLKGFLGESGAAASEATEGGAAAAGKGVAGSGVSVPVATPSRSSLMLAPPPLPRLPTINGNGSGNRNAKPGEEVKAIDLQKLADAKKKEEEERPRIRLLDFQVGEFFAHMKDGNIYRAIAFNWTPAFPIPVLPFIEIRGAFGFNVQPSRDSTGAPFKGDTPLNHFLIHEYQVLAALTLLKPLYFEVGGGEQIWRVHGFDTGIASANVGLVLRDKAWLERIFLGASKTRAKLGIDEFRAGVGLHF